jgi:hypothetical protein
MLYFGTMMPQSLINPNQLRAYGHDVNDDPFNSTRVLGIESENATIPFDTTGTIIHFESRVPTEWEKNHLPIILLTGEEWNPTKEMLRPRRQSRESVEMRAIQSLRTAREQPSTDTEVNVRKPLGIYDTKELCECLIASVNIAMAYHGDIDEWHDERKVRSIISNERHSKVTPEEIARKWSIGIQTAKDTVRVTTQ